MEFNLNLIINCCLKLIEFDSQLPLDWDDALNYIITAESDDEKLEIVQYLNII